MIVQRNLINYLGIYIRCWTIFYNEKNYDWSLFCICTNICCCCYDAVNSFWSSNIKVMALRDLPLEVQVIKQIVLPELSYTHHCFEQCENNFDCRKLQGCGYCRKQSYKSPFKRCLTPRWPRFNWRILWRKGLDYERF